MKKLWSVFIFCTFNPAIIYAQDAGIGISTPLARLHVYTGPAGSSTPYGPLVLESGFVSYMHVLAPSAFESGILFGRTSDAAHGGIIYNNYTYPGSLLFRTNGNIDRMILSEAGYLGIGVTDPIYHLDVNQRIRLRSNASEPAGIWFNNANNTALQAFIGIENDTYVGIFNPSGGKAFGINNTNGDVEITGRLGINTTAPGAPLSFPPEIGKKIIFYPGATGNVGIGWLPGLLQIYSDNPNADIALGYNQGGTITEKFRFKANGGIALSGNTGAINNVFTTGGSGPAQFQSLGNLSKTSYGFSGSSVSTVEVNSFDNLETEIPSLATSITVSQASNLIINAAAHFSNYCAGLDCIGSVSFKFKVNGVTAKPYLAITTTDMKAIQISGYFFEVPAGTHTITFWFYKTFHGDNHLAGNGIMSTVMALPLQ